MSAAIPEHRREVFLLLLLALPGAPSIAQDAASGAHPPPVDGHWLHAGLGS